MIDRYTSEAMALIWSEVAKYERWLKMESLVVEHLSDEKILPNDKCSVLIDTLSNIKINEDSIKEIKEIERETKHDLVAFITWLERKCGDEGRYIHLGLTSSDIVDTSYAYAIKKSYSILSMHALELISSLKDLASKHVYTIQSGRTHGVYAEALTFGIKVSGWAAQVNRAYEAMSVSVASATVVKMSGPIGTYVSIPDTIESLVAQNLRMNTCGFATQVIPRDRFAHYFQSLALMASVLENIATEIRHLSSSGIEEVKEGFGENQKGSSSMPHKMNPIKCENVCGLARLIRSYADAALENVTLWHERDISHSSVERVIGPDANSLLEYMISSMTNIIKELYVDTDKMSKNVESTNELILSHTYLCAFVKAGWSREKSHKSIQNACNKVKQTNKKLSEVLVGLNTPLSKEEIIGIATTYKNEIFSMSEKMVRYWADKSDLDK